MKILEINKFFYKKGGAESYLFAVRELLKKNGNEVVDFSMNHERNEVSKYQKYFTHPVEMDGGGILSSLHLAFHAIYSLEAEAKLDQLLKENTGIEVAHLQNFYYQLSPSIINALKRFNIPIVWTLHDYKLISPNYNLFSNGKIDESTKPDHYFSCVKNKSVKNSYLKSFLAASEQYLHKKITHLYDQADLFIAPSKYMADLVVEYGVSKEKVRQLYNFVDLDSRSPSYEPGDYYLFIGRLIEEKGVLRLIQSWKNLPDLKLKIIGSGELSDKVESMVNSQSSNVELIGSVYGEKMFEYLKNAKAVIIPSIWYENNPIVALDAMSFGKPIIGSNLGGIPELIEDGRSGMIYNPFESESLERTLRNFEELGSQGIRELGINARKKVEEIASPQGHYEKLMEIFEEAINKN